MTFNNIQEYYDYIESDNTLPFELFLSNTVINLRNKIAENENKIYCTYESLFADFAVNYGGIRQRKTFPNGGIYPHYNLFDDNFTYIKSRADTVNNPKYKAKYYHFLWESEVKHIDFAKKAIDNYISLLKNSSFSLDDHLSNHAFENYYLSLFILSQSINYKKEESLEYFLSILGKSKISGYNEFSIMKYIIDEGKKIAVKVLKFLFEYSNKVIDESVFPDFVQQYLQLLILISQKLILSPNPYHIRLAEFYMAQSRKQEGSFVVNDYYLKALAQYQKAGDKKKMEEVTILIEKAKRNVNFKTIKVEHNDEIVQKWWDTINKFTDDLTENHQSLDIYQYIMLSDKLFPKADVLNDMVRPTMFDFMSVLNFDINKNISGKQKSGINPYLIHIQNFTLEQLRMIFVKGIKKGKVSFESLIGYLKKHSWYGQEFTFLNADNEVEGFDWIELLSPSLESFFKQSESDISQNKNNATGYILAIDSLVIKFEGLIREFSRNIGAQTIEIKENGTEERISFEKLLENEKFKEIISQDDIALLKFLFTSEGMNLRNNVAHCFYKTRSYSPGVMFLLIAALLKLGNYKFKIKE